VASAEVGEAEAAAVAEAAGSYSSPAALSAAPRS
jgi:hypothetical protein